MYFKIQTIRCDTTVLSLWIQHQFKSMIVTDEHRTLWYALVAVSRDVSKYRYIYIKHLMHACFIISCMLCMETYGTIWLFQWILYLYGLASHMWTCATFLSDINFELHIFFKKINLTITNPLNSQHAHFASSVKIP